MTLVRGCRGKALRFSAGFVPEAERVRIAHCAHGLGDGADFVFHHQIAHGAYFFYRKIFGSQFAARYGFPHVQQFLCGVALVLVWQWRVGHLFSFSCVI